MNNPNPTSPPKSLHPHPSTTASETPLFKASHYANDGKKHLLLSASGSVATIKIPSIITALAPHTNLSIRLILTPSATTFLSGQSDEQPSLSTIRQMANVDGIYLDSSEWAKPWERNDPILHIELRRWSDLMVIAPLSADMMAKIVGGLADGLLSSVVRAWDTTGLIDPVNLQSGGLNNTTMTTTKKRIVMAMAMNTAMWRQPVTGRQIRVLEEEWGVLTVGQDGRAKGSEEGWVEVLRPQEKELACGDVGDGAMRDWREIVTVIKERLGLGSGE